MRLTIQFLYSEVLYQYTSNPTPGLSSGTSESAEASPRTCMMHGTADRAIAIKNLMVLQKVTLSG